MILSDSVSDTAAWEALGEEVSVRRLDPARTAQMRATSEMMLFRHIMETELLRKLVRAHDPKLNKRGARRCGSTQL